MKETSQEEIIRLAVKHKDNPAISVLLTSFNESKAAAIQSSHYLDSRIGVALNSIDFKHDFSIPLDNKDIVIEAHKLASAMSSMNMTLMNLACVLQSLGEDIVY